MTAPKQDAIAMVREALRKLMDAFDDELADELAREGERADLWPDIDVPIGLLRRLLSALDEWERENGWRPIAEAPKDGTRIMVAWLNDGWRFSEAFWVADHPLPHWQAADSVGMLHLLHPTHFSPLPPPPRSE